MSAARKLEWIGPQEYLQLEQAATVKHEYVDGLIYAMSGASRAHNTVGLNIATAARRSARFRTPCQVYVNDVKVHVATRNSYYYPDVVVSCRPEADALWVSAPCLIVEVLSASTAATDRREKRVAYAALASLQTYVLVEQEHARIVVFRRDGTGWIEETLGADDLLHLDCLELDVPVSEVYAGVTLAVSPPDDVDGM